MNKVKIVGGALAAGLAFTIMFISQWEGVRYVAYRDISGVWTICYGHTEGVKEGDTATPEECRAQIKAETLVYWEEVDRLVTPEMTSWQHSAFTDFAYNLGIGAFEGSTILKKFNAGNVLGACDELLRWVYAGKPKRVIGWQVKRRAAEHQLCIGAMAE
jgi:lysozyme